MSIHVNARDRSLSHANPSTAVSCDDPSKKFEKVGIVANNQDPFAICILADKFLECNEVALGSKRRTYFDVGLVAKLGPHKLRCLQSAL